MATLTSSGITFSDASTLNSKYGIVPQNSVSVFYQANAPTGWVKSTANNDKALRVVSGTGGGTAGTTPFSNIFPTSLRPVSQPGVPMSGTVGNHTLTNPQIPFHEHSSGAVALTYTGAGDVQYGPGWTRSAVATGQQPAGNGAHSHPWSGTCDFTGSFDMRILYMDVIVCSFS